MSDRCPRCKGTHTSGLGDAQCHFRAEATADVRAYAVSLDVDAVAALDLLAHLRCVFPEDQARRAARYVIDLGWRPVVGQQESFGAGV